MEESTLAVRSHRTHFSAEQLEVHDMWTEVVEGVLNPSHT